MTAVTLLSTARGDFQVHLGGCSDIAKASRGSRDAVRTFAGDDLVAAIIALDTDAASWFGETPYTPESRDAGCWATRNGFDPAPCFVKAIAAERVAFDADGRPYVESGSAVAK